MVDKTIHSHFDLGKKIVMNYFLFRHNFFEEKKELMGFQYI